MTEHVNAAEHLPGTQKVYQAKGIMKYYLYLPPGDTPPGGWPIILFLHGIGEASQNYTDQWVQQPIDVVKSHNSPASLCATQPSESQRLLNSFIVVSPQFPFVPNEKQKAQGRQGRTWQWADQVDTITHILDVVTGEFNGNAERIYATGFSKGGRGALALAQQLKNYSIAKLVLVDSQSVPTTLPDIPTWVHYSGPNTIENIVDEHRGLIKQLGQGVWKSAPAGAPAPPSRQLFTNWNLTLPSQSENHTATSRCAYSDPRVYEWLLDKDQPQSAS
jgi:predicted peptidase